MLDKPTTTPPHSDLGKAGLMENPGPPASRAPGGRPALGCGKNRVA